MNTKCESLFDLVYEAYCNAIDNGYPIDSWSVHDIVVDMQNCTDDIACYAYDDVFATVYEVRNVLLNAL